MVTPAAILILQSVVTLGFMFEIHKPTKEEYHRLLKNDSAQVHGNHMTMNHLAILENVNHKHDDDVKKQGHKPSQQDV